MSATVITIAQPKGGAGKTTTSLLLALELASKGANVTILDADPEQWISQWAKLDGKPNNISIISKITETNLDEKIEVASRTAQFIIIDPEGTASLLVADAISYAHLVLVPIQGSSLDARGGAKVIGLIRKREKMMKRDIPHAVVLTRTSAAVTSRALKNVIKQLDNAGVPCMHTALVERAAFRDLFDYGGTLDDLDPSLVSNVEKAKKNAREFAGEVLMMLKDAWQAEDQKKAVSA